MRHYAGTALMLLVTTAAVVGSYTVNLKVSGERAQVTALKLQLADDARRIRDLQVELRTRARLPELQRWNDMVLHMSAPQATQYLRSPVQLAGFAAEPADAPQVQLAVTPPTPADPAPAPVLRTVAPAAASTPAAPVRVAYPAPVSGPAKVVAATYAPRPARLAADIAATLDSPATTAEHTE